MGVHRWLVGFIHIHTNRACLVGVVIRHAYAADGEDRLHLTIGAADLHIGHLRADIICAFYPKLFDRIAGKAGDGNGNILGTLAAALGGDYDFFQCLRHKLAGAAATRGQ